MKRREKILNSIRYKDFESELSKRAINLSIYEGCYCHNFPLVCVYFILSVFGGKFQQRHFSVDEVINNNNNKPYLYITLHTRHAAYIQYS